MRTRCKCVGTSNPPHYFSAPAQGAWLTPPNALPITRQDPRIRADARFGGVSRAAKGADCKSAGLAFVGSSPTSPTNLKTKEWPVRFQPIHVACVARYSPVI